MYDVKRTDGKLLNSIEAVCSRLDLGRTSIYALVKARELEIVKVGKKSLVPERSILAYVEKLTGKAA